jgi:glyoxylase-like metal-dependent hydrolase (beta-lactamase superfamily II)
VITHLHPDHLGLARRLRERTGADILLHAEEQRALTEQPDRGLRPELIDLRLDAWRVPPERRDELRAVTTPEPAPIGFRADRLLEDGDLLDAPGLRVEALWTPGHTLGHLCLVLPELGMVLTGDHLMATTNSGLGLGGLGEGNPLRHYFESLHRLPLDARTTVLPAHDYMFRDGPGRRASAAMHFVRRARDVARVLESEPEASVWEIGSRLVWRNGWEGLSGFYLHSALQQTAMHVEYVRGGGSLEDWSPLTPTLDL